MTPQHPTQSTRGGHLDYFGVRPACGCITAWLAVESTSEEVAEFARRMRESGRDVIRGTLDEYHGRLDRCPHWDGLPS